MLSVSSYLHWNASAKLAVMPVIGLQKQDQDACEKRAPLFARKASKTAQTVRTSGRAASGTLILP